MSAAHDDAHGYAAPEPVEITNPLLWSVFLLAACLALVWWFFHWLDSGRVEGRRGERIPQVGKATMAVEPDHRKLAADRSQDVIDHGALLYAKNCASCHGTNGDNPPSISGRRRATSAPTPSRIRSAAVPMACTWSSRGASAACRRSHPSAPPTAMPC